MQSQIIDALERGRIVLVTGVRGTGKTTLMRSVERSLARSRGAGKIAYQDLEDPRFAPRPRKETLELFYRDSRYVFLDEVGRVDGWIDWARRVSQRQGAGVVASISGPRSNLGADDVEEHTLYPLRLADTSVNMNRYLMDGGLPGVQEADDVRRALVDLFNLCLYKDVVQRHEVRDIDKLTAISVYLLASTARQVSATRLKGLLSRSVDQARGFLAHLERAGLIHLVPRIEDGQRSRAQAARRCFAADCGLSVALSGGDLAVRDLAETAVFHELLRQGQSIQAWRARGRLGLAVAGESAPRLLVDVGYRDRAAADHRALAAAMTAHGCGTGLWLTDQGGTDPIEVAGGVILKRKLSDWLEAPELPGISVSSPGSPRKKRPPKPKSPEPEEPSGLPPHLL